MKKYKDKKDKKEKQKNPLHKDYGLFSNMRFVLSRMVKTEHSAVALIILWAIVAPVTVYLWNIIIKLVIDLISFGGTRENLLIIILICAVIQILANIIANYSSYMLSYKYIDARLIILNSLNYKLMKVKFQCLEDPDVMDAYQKGSNACNDNMNGLEGTMHSTDGFFRSLTCAVAGLCIMGTLDPVLVIIMGALSVLTFVCSDRIGAYTKKTVWDALASWWRKDNYMRNTYTSFDMAKDIRLYGLSGWLSKKYSELNDFRYKKQVTNERWWALNGFLSALAWLVAQCLVYGLLIYRAVSGTMAIGDFTLYVAAAGTFFQQVSEVLKQVGQLRQCSRQVSDFRSIYDYADSQISDEGKPIPRTESYEFKFNNVSFKYPKAEKYALKNMNITLSPGKKLAVVGLNGAGKSTFVKLLLRLYEPTEGYISLNGTDIREFNREDYYQLFAPVFQEVNLFAFPLSQNISMATPESTDAEKAESALRDSGFGEDLDKLSSGINTQVLKVLYDDGIDFSGGQRQKIALARALYKNAPIVVLDEPTAALDPLAEYKLYMDFDKLIQNKTAVYISHRLSSTRFCDNVAMFMDGEMVEYGDHESLLAKNGEYAKMFHIQAQYYSKENKEEKTQEDAAYAV